MKHAILIMTHTKPNQVKRLLRYFPEDKCVCFLHVDSKADFDYQSFKKEVEDEFSNCIVLEKRLSGILACWSLVEVTMLLLKEAYFYGKQNRIHFDYYRLLSGQDYPIRTFELYDDLLNSEYPRNFVGVEWPNRRNHVEMKFARWRMDSIREWAYNLTRMRVAGKVLVGVVHTIELLVAVLGFTPRSYCEKRGINVAGGASWWTITNQFAEYVINRYDEKDIITSICQNLATPEEIYFQLLYVNSSFFQLDKNKKHYNLTYCNYGRRQQVVDGHTHPWVTADYDELILSDCFFARKFDMELDCEILDLLDLNIYGE